MVDSGFLSSHNDYSVEGNAAIETGQNTMSLIQVVIMEISKTKHVFFTSLMPGLCLRKVLHNQTCFVGLDMIYNSHFNCHNWCQHQSAGKHTLC